MKKRGQIAGLVFVLAAVAVLSPWLKSRSAAERLFDCKSNLRNLGTAMEMYSTDWSGRYPDSLDKLVPRYLPSIPQCPAAPRGQGYGLEGPESSHNPEGFQDYYYLYCLAENHPGSAENLPGFDGIHSVIERP